MYQRIVSIPRPDYASQRGEVTHLQLWEGIGAVESIDDVPNIGTYVLSPYVLMCVWCT